MGNRNEIPLPKGEGGAERRVRGEGNVVTLTRLSLWESDFPLSPSP
jgi:hypothetical protein